MELTFGFANYEPIVSRVYKYLSEEMEGTPEFRSKIAKHFEYYMYEDRHHKDNFFHIILFARLHGFPKPICLNDPHRLIVIEK